jgi:DNA-binding CsgD family transcriptional regulator/PAS domain-containing protein
MAVMEAFDKRTIQHREFFMHGAPPVAEIEYLDHYAALNVRLPAHTAARVGDVLHDYAILDADAIARAPFYAEFLRHYDLRFFISGIVASSEQEVAVVSVQRSFRQAHVGNNEIALMRHLLPHISQAFNVARRLKGATETNSALERALDWLVDGAALFGTDGTVLFANEAFHTIVRRDDGIRLRKGKIELAAGEARDRLDSALAAAERLANGDVKALAARDFIVPRRSGSEPYLVSVRPLLAGSHARQPQKYLAILFVRDPLARGAPVLGALRELFGLTEAEAALALALQSGTSVNDYAHSRGLSLNTVYTHLRRLREKTGSGRLPELIHKLNELRLPLRLE